MFFITLKAYKCTVSEIWRDSFVLACIACTSYPYIQSLPTLWWIRRTRNTCQYKKISPNLRNGTLISLYNHIPFIFECFHDQQDSSHREKPSRKYHTRHSQNGQIVFLSFFFFFLSSDNLAQRCLNLSRWFSHETAAFSTEQCNVPSLFATSKSSPGGCSCPLNNYGFICHAIFTFVRMRT